jgi:hypothetical protein
MYLSSQDLGGVFREIALGISIGDTDINDAICSVDPKSTDTQVSSYSTSVLTVQVVGNCWINRDQLWHLDCGATCSSEQRENNNISPLATLASHALT